MVFARARRLATECNTGAPHPEPNIYKHGSSSRIVIGVCEVGLPGALVLSGLLSQLLRTPVQGNPFKDASDASRTDSDTGAA